MDVIVIISCVQTRSFFLFLFLACFLPFSLSPTLHHSCFLSFVLSVFSWEIKVVRLWFVCDIILKVTYLRKGDDIRNRGWMAMVKRQPRLRTSSLFLSWGTLDTISHISRRRSTLLPQIRSAHCVSYTHTFTQTPRYTSPSTHTLSLSLSYTHTHTHTPQYTPSIGILISLSLSLTHILLHPLIGIPICWDGMRVWTRDLVTSESNQTM